MRTRVDRANDRWQPVGTMLVVCFLAIWLVPPSVAGAATAALTPQTGIAVAGQLGGRARAIAMQRTTLFLAVGPRVEVFDVANPAQPRLLGQTPLMPGDVQQVAVDDTALAATYQAQAYPQSHVGLITFDVSTPAAPREEGRLTWMGHVAGLAISGTTAYVALEPLQGPGSSLLAIDLSNPAIPRVLGSYGEQDSTPNVVIAAGPTVYLLAGGTVQLLSFANLAQPERLSTITLPPIRGIGAPARDASVMGNVLVVTQGENVEHGGSVGGVRTYDVRNPHQPVALGMLDMGGYANGVQIGTAQMAYVAATDGIHVIDLTSPSHPLQADVLALEPVAGALTLSGTTLATLQDGPAPLRLIDVSNPAQPRVAGAADAIASIFGIALAGATLYVANDLSTLAVLDVSDPRQPVQRTQLAVSGGIVQLAAAPPYVYGISGPTTQNGQYVPGVLTVINVTDPTKPAIVATLDLSGRPGDVTVADGRLYIATQSFCGEAGATSGGLLVVDVADPLHPKEAGAMSLAMGCDARVQVVPAGQFAIVTTSLGKTGGDVHLVDVADPQHPTLTDTLTEPSYPTPAISGHTLYLGIDNRLHVLDVTSAAQPREITSVAAPDYLATLAVSGRTLLGSGADTTEVFDIANPTQPVLAGTYRGLGAINLAAAGDTLYVGSQLDGLWVLRALFSAQAALPAPPAAPHDARYFPQTGYRIDDDAFWSEFTHRGGIQTFGYPTSRVFTFEGFSVQFFQRQVLQRFPDGSVHLLNLLDPSLLPYTTFNGSTFPTADPVLMAQAPAVGSPGYANAVVQFVQQQAPDAWNGLLVHFQQTFLRSTTLQEAVPNGGNPALLPLLDLEIWGLPTSQPAYDPHNHQFVDQRFERGIMQYDAGCGCTQGILMADYLKAILMAANLPHDLASEAADSPFFAQYCPGAPGWLCRPEDLPGTDLTEAFRPE